MLYRYEAPIALGCGVGGVLLFWSFFYWAEAIQRFEEKLLPEKLHWIMQWQLLGGLLWVLLCSVSAIILGHKYYAQLNEGTIISGFLLAVAGLAVGYGFNALYVNGSPTGRVMLACVLPLFLLGGSGAAIGLGYVSVDALMAAAGLVLGYINLFPVLIGILFAIIPWGNS